MVREYKDWLFVKVPKDATDFRIWEDQPNRLYADVPYDDGWVLDPPLPSGSYQIIGKGDAISESEWDKIITTFKSSWGTQYYPEFPLEKTQGSRRTKPGFDKATPSGHSLLRSFGMEPETTLVLKKNEK